jgi:hypothetical protein
MSDRAAQINATPLQKCLSCLVVERVHRVARVDRGIPETNIRTDARLQMENVEVPSRTRVVRRGDSPLRHSSEWCLTR